jgi:N-acetylmuramoyl-L-alanine amidase
VVRAGGIVRLTVPAGTGGPISGSHVGAVVVIDPGHQSRGDSTREPIGPGADEKKARVTGGTTGVVTRLPEYEVVLQIAVNLKMRLESEGVTVVMTRTTNDVNISNAERAAIANDESADLFVRIHADGNVDSSQAGISTLYPGVNSWTAPIAAPSHRAARLVHGALLGSTGAASRGVVPRTDLTGFNWSKVPVLLVECGFMTNPVEDRLLSSPHYQDKLAEGMASGIIAFLGE